jgi:hypothetical protein
VTSGPAALSLGAAGTYIASHRRRDTAMGDDSQPPKVDFSGSGPVEYRPADDGSTGRAQDVLAAHEAELLAMRGVVSVGVGFGPAGREALLVGVVDAGVAARLPAEMDGVPVIVTVTGEVDAQVPKP